MTVMNRYFDVNRERTTTNAHTQASKTVGEKDSLPRSQTNTGRKVSNQTLLGGCGELTLFFSRGHLSRGY